MRAYHVLFADRRGLTLGEYERQAHARLLELVGSSSIRLRTRIAHLDPILASGRVKTQFETNVSSGYFNSDLRRAFEQLVLGVPLATPPAWRPLYGYLEGSAEHVIASLYGSVVLQLHDDVRARATFTLGDTLHATAHGTCFAFAPQPVAHPSLLAAFVARDLLTVDSIGLAAPQGYAEVQIYGQVRVARDVRRVIFTHGLEPDSRLATTLDGIGLEWMATGRIEP